MTQFAMDIWAMPAALLRGRQGRASNKVASLGANGLLDASSIPLIGYTLIRYDEQRFSITGLLDSILFHLVTLGPFRWGSH